MKYLALVLCLSLPAMADIAVDQLPKEQVNPPAPAPQHPQGIEKVQMGVIEGGWGYVYAAYGAGLLGLVAYAASLFLRQREGTQADGNAAPPPGAP
jgi:hypothetical protein